MKPICSLVLVLLLGGAGCATIYRQPLSNDEVFQRYFPNGTCQFEALDRDGHLVATMTLRTVVKHGVTQLGRGYSFVDLAPDYRGWRVKQHGAPCGIIGLEKGVIYQERGYHVFRYNFATGVGSLVDSHDKGGTYRLRLAAL